MGNFAHIPVPIDEDYAIMITKFNQSIDLLSRSANENEGFIDSLKSQIGSSISIPNSILGTTNQVIVTDSGGNKVTLSTPQDIAPTSSPTFVDITGESVTATDDLTLAGKAIFLNSSDDNIEVNAHISGTSIALTGAIRANGVTYPVDGASGQVLESNGLGTPAFNTITSGTNGDLQFKTGNNFTGGGPSWLSNVLNADGSITANPSNGQWEMGDFGSLIGARNTGNSDSGFIQLRKSRGNKSTPAIVQNGDDVFGILFRGYDGTDYRNTAQILTQIDGVPGSNDMPGRLLFYTTPDGSATLSERMRIDSSGNVGIGAVVPSSLLHLKGAGAELRIEDTSDSPQLSFLDSAGSLRGNIHIGDSVAGEDEDAVYYNSDTGEFHHFTVNGTDTMVVGGASARVGIGTTGPNEKLEVAGKIRANTAFNLNGTDGLMEVLNFNGVSSGQVLTLTLSGGIATARTLVP